MYLTLAISNTPYISIPIDFTGKKDGTERNMYLCKCALLLINEYGAELNDYGGEYEVYYSITPVVEVTDFELKQFDIKIRNNQFLKITGG